MFLSFSKNKIVYFTTTTLLTAKYINLTLQIYGASTWSIQIRIKLKIVPKISVLKLQPYILAMLSLSLFSLCVHISACVLAHKPSVCCYFAKHASYLHVVVCEHIRLKPLQSVMLTLFACKSQPETQLSINRLQI